MDYLMGSGPGHDEPLGDIDGLALPGDAGMRSAAFGRGWLRRGTRRRHGPDEGPGRRRRGGRRTGRG
ncbi:hypothetical protein THAOC_32565, partial [Thalassiosira oceanica]